MYAPEQMRRIGVPFWNPYSSRFVRLLDDAFDDDGLHPDPLTAWASGARLGLLAGCDLANPGWDNCPTLITVPSVSQGIDQVPQMWHLQHSRAP
jgi:hypothetical protein